MSARRRRLKRDARGDFRPFIGYPIHCSILLSKQLPHGVQPCFHAWLWPLIQL